MTDDELIEEVRRTLEGMVARVKRRAPGVVAVARYDGARQPYASFAASVSSESLDLCVLLHPQEGGAIECTADLVRGGSGDILGEMPAVTRRGVADAVGTERVIEAIRSFCSAQEDRVVREIQGGGA